MIGVGFIISTWVGYGASKVPATSSFSWRFPLAFQCVPCLMLIFGIMFFPESPRYLVETDRSDEALRVLHKLHYDGTNEDWINQEFNEIKLTIEAEKAITAPGWAIMFKVPTWRTRLLHATSIQAFGQMTGYADLRSKPYSLTDCSPQYQRHRLLLDDYVPQPWYRRRSRIARYRHLQRCWPYLQLDLHRLLPRPSRQKKASAVRHDWNHYCADLRSRSGFTGQGCHWIPQRRPVCGRCVLPVPGILHLQRVIRSDLLGIRFRDHATEYSWSWIGFRNRYW